ncbi:MAG: hypothetical protein KIT17_10665 [Rubrivivax sp.]|nr:hypothetical protein [Rubrivivax sp.]
MGLQPDQSQRLVALFALGVLLLTYPLLAVFNRAEFVLGIPVLYAYLFGAWGGLIALLALAAWRRAPHDAADALGEPAEAVDEGQGGAGAAHAAPATTATPATPGRGDVRDRRP